MIRKPYLIYLSALAILLGASCSNKNISYKAEYQFKSKNGTPDYTDKNYWAAHPWKWDTSDSVPAPLRDKSNNDSAVDVFFIHPTTLTSKKNKNSNALIDDASINIKTDFSPILYQASAFNERSRVFAPRYRQAHLGNYFTEDTLRAKKAFDLAYLDIKKAFETYLTDYNNGRPIIIASHSQGTTHALRLLKEYFEGKELQKSLVCAYIIGMPVSNTYFITLKPCVDSLSTGCFVSWRTYEKGFEGSKSVKNESFKAVVVNPLSWSLDSIRIPAILNSGGVLKNFNKVLPGVVDAQIYKNILWSSKPKFFGSFLLTTKNYHIADINFFYSNIRHNVNTRIDMYLKKQKTALNDKRK